MYTFPVRPRTLKTLAKMAQPQTVEGGQSEALSWDLYDTQLYVSGVTTQLTFFTAAPATRFIGNTPGSGLPTPQYFETYFFGVDILRVPGATTVWNDYWVLLNGAGGALLAGAPTWTFTLADKQMGPFPLRGLHGMGGIDGFTTNPTTEYANNGGMRDSFSADGALVIPPTQQFQVDLRWPAAQALTSDTQIQVWLKGVLHRRVL